MVGIASAMQVRALPTTSYLTNHASFTAMTKIHFKPGGNSKDRRRRLKALEAVWGAFVDYWIATARLRSCKWIKVQVFNPDGMTEFSTGEIYLTDRAKLFKKAAQYGNPQIHTFQASAKVTRDGFGDLLHIRLQRSGNRKDSSGHLGVRGPTEKEAG